MFFFFQIFKLKSLIYIINRLKFFSQYLNVKMFDIVFTIRIFFNNINNLIEFLTKNVIY